ncbi:putative diguanylate cyclase YedQ [Massilia sp. Bi118]|uniref:diguanylate cyclase n=1 Tax=Massilia sp. Bi118 TaxID=2822346 RepID=UPI001D8FF931|nr:diguanylate cyclase [Massilia sp. Bi118]CAH0189104.1 putative diguanylate cyclase YedQ [Massilia sp. Bi118]
MIVRRFLFGLLFLCWTALAHAGADQDDFMHALATAREEAYVTPTAALARLDTLKEGRSGQALGHLLVETSRANFWLGKKQEALAAALEAEKLGRASHDDALLAKAMLSHGLVLSRLVHDQDAARRLIASAAALAEKTEDIHLKTRALVAQGLLADQEGRSDDALDYVEQAAGIARSGADPDALAMALREQARLMAVVGDAAPALKLADELLAIARSRGIPAQLAHARLIEYATAAHAGNPRRAEKALQAAVDILEKLDARERLAVPLANLAELYVQSRRFGEAARTSEAALRIAREVGDENGARLASYELGLSYIYFRNVAQGRQMVDTALEGLKDDERYVRMLLDYGHALNQVGWGDVALTVYEKAGSVSLAAWRKEKQLSYQALQRAWAYQKKQAELTAAHHESQLKAAELTTIKRLRTLWVALSVTTLVAVLLIALLYGRVKKANGTLKVKNEQLFRQSTRDSLTGLFNRHYFYEHVVPSYHENPGRDGKSGGVFLLMDVDHFKSINDRFGHSAGDVVLKNVAARLAASLREQDVLIRWGGEEFLAYLPGVATDEARQLCARLLAAVCGTPIDADGQQLTVSVSIGFCPRPVALVDGGPDWEKLVHLADLCLYLAKTAGRNQAFGVADANALTPAAIAAADADLGQASADGLVDLVNVKTTATS